MPKERFSSVVKNLNTRTEKQGRKMSITIAQGFEDFQESKSMGKPLNTMIKERRSQLRCSWLSRIKLRKTLKGMRVMQLPSSKLKKIQRDNRRLKKADAFVRKIPIIGWIHTKFDSENFNNWFPAFQALSIVTLIVYFSVKIVFR